jgi:hypothetical protein
MLNANASFAQDLKTLMEHFDRIRASARASYPQLAESDVDALTSYTVTRNGLAANDALAARVSPQGRALAVKLGLQ